MCARDSLRPLLCLGSERHPVWNSPPRVVAVEQTEKRRKRRIKSPSVDLDLFLWETTRKDLDPLLGAVNLKVVWVTVNLMLVLAAKRHLCHSVPQSKNRWHRAQ